MKTIAEIFSSYEELDENGRHIGGTDKHGPNHRYGAAYESLLHDVREDARLVMEVGIADGSSLLAWREVFPNALCVGLDIMPDAGPRLATYTRTEFHVGDATLKEVCDRTAGSRKFDLIVEDATHRLEDTLRTLLYLWPYVRPRGGLYVIEEFANVGALQDNLFKLFSPRIAFVHTVGPFGGDEPLVVLRKE